MPIIKILELSTAHIQKSTDATLTELAPLNKQAMPRIIKNVIHQYGYILFFSPETDIDELEGFLSEKNMLELFAIIKYAIKNKCYMINLDRDAEEMKIFKTFVW